MIIPLRGLVQRRRYHTGRQRGDPRLRRPGVTAGDIAVLNRQDESGRA